MSEKNVLITLGKCADLRNDLSDIINTWNGTGVDALDVGLYEALDGIVGKFDALNLRVPTISDPDLEGRN